MIDKDVLDVVHKKFIEAGVQSIHLAGCVNAKMEALEVKQKIENLKHARAVVVAMLLDKKKAHDNIIAGFETLQKKQTSGESDMKPYLDAIKKSQEEMQKLPSEPILDAMVKYSESLRSVADAYEVLARTSLFGIDQLSDALFFF